MPAPAMMAPWVPWLAASGFGWIYYRRIRRQFGRQVYQPRRTVFRLVVLALVACGLVFAAFAVPHVALGIAAGAAIGVVLGALSIRHTRIAVVNGVREYTPNAWIGGALSVLLLGRLAWRWHDGAFSAGAQQMGQQASPLTFAFLGTLIAYYLVSAGGLYLRMRALPKGPLQGDADRTA